jgi:hypothetical protein
MFGPSVIVAPVGSSIRLKAALKDEAGTTTSGFTGAVLSPTIVFASALVVPP